MLLDCCILPREGKVAEMQKYATSDRSTYPDGDAHDYAQISLFFACYPNIQTCRHHIFNVK